MLAEVEQFILRNFPQPNHIYLIAAINADQMIGMETMDADGRMWCDLPWPRVSTDMTFFRTVTNGGTVIVGRRTWDTLPRGLAGRTCRCVTSKPDGSTFLTTSVEDAIASAPRLTPIFLAGGRGIYQAALSLPACAGMFLTYLPDFGGGTIPFPRDVLDRSTEVDSCEVRDPRTGVRVRFTFNTIVTNEQQEKSSTETSAGSV